MPIFRDPEKHFDWLRVDEARLEQVFLRSLGFMPKSGAEKSPEVWIFSSSFNNFSNDIGNIAKCNGYANSSSFLFYLFFFVWGTLSPDARVFGLGFSDWRQKSLIEVERRDFYCCAFVEQRSFSPTEDNFLSGMQWKRDSSSWLAALVGRWDR